MGRSRSISGEQYDISAGEHRVTVAEVGAGLRRYEVAGVGVTCGYGLDTLPPKGCGTTLVPWPNRLDAGRYTFDGVEQQLALSEPDLRNAIHGLGRWARWAPVEHTADAVTLRLDVVPQKGFPFEVRVEVTFAVHAEHGLRVSFAAVNRGEQRAPFGAGSHPYLSARGHALDDVTLTLPVAEQLVVDDRQLPTGQRPVSGDVDFRAGRRLGGHRFDMGFTGIERGPDGRGVAELRTPDGGARLWVDESFRFLQSYTVDDLTPGCSGVAVEPMSCAPNAFNSGDGLVVLEPDDEWHGTWGVRPL